MALRNIFKGGESTDREGAFLERLRRMDARAWDQVTREYRGGILSACWYRVRNRADAEDLCSQVFVRAVSSIDRFRGDASLKTWLHTIAANLCATHFARAVNNRHVALDDGPAGGPVLASDAPLPDRMAGSAEARSAVGRALDALDPVLREAFILRELEDLSYDEIAKITAVPINTVKTRIFRARERLQLLLADHR